MLFTACKCMHAQTRGAMVPYLPLSRSNVVCSVLYSPAFWSSSLVDTLMDTLPAQASSCPELRC